MSGASTDIARTPKPPYYAVVFTSIRTDAEQDAYGQRAEEMVALAAQQPGYLGVDSARGEGGVGITVSYWQSLEAIRAWREHADHKLTQRAGRERWYRTYAVRVCKVERAYDFP